MAVHADPLAGYTSYVSAPSLTPTPLSFSPTTNAHPGREYTGWITDASDVSSPSWKAAMTDSSTAIAVVEIV